MKSVNIICNEIRHWVNVYGQINESSDIDTLLNIQDQIAIRTLTLANHVSSYKTSFNAHYFIRKIGVAKSSLAYQKQGLKQGQSDSQALVDNADQFEMEQSHEATAVQLDLLLRQTNVILQAISQRISYYKQEKIAVNRQNVT
jgi:hypothetical protein